VWVEPKVVELDGPADLVREIGNSGRVYTVPVDLAGASSDAQYSVALDLPEGVTALNALDGVTVTVEIEALPGTRTLELAVERRGLREGLVADITPDRVQVLLSGPEPELDALAAEGADDVVAYVDLSDLSPGAHRVLVGVDAPPNLRVGSTTPEEVEVVIRTAAGARLLATSTPSSGR
jgi:YbbR domain-containing protein